ncbi:MAG: SIR2 family NAD-dependent protein deacylase [Muribaculaceae bacterium]
MKKLVISTGAGMSAESGIRTFRDSDGLWEEYPVMEVASHTGFLRNPELIHKFYNDRRKQLVNAKPNAGHLGLVELEKYFDVQVITQNVDDLHERAGSSKVLHLHGELMKMQSMKNENHVYTLDRDHLETSTATRDQYGDPVRPFIVFFEEAVPNFTPAMKMVQQADILVVIGTSLAVYPAASLINCTRPGTPIFYIDPNPSNIKLHDVKVIAKPATEGVKELIEILKTMQ